MVVGYVGNEKRFLKFRMKISGIFFAILLLVSLGSATVWYQLSERSWLVLTVLSTFLLVKNLFEEIGVFRRVRSGTFGISGEDELLWRQFVRFRDKKPGRFLNQDID